VSAERRTETRHDGAIVLVSKPDSPRAANRVVIGSKRPTPAGYAVAMSDTESVWRLVDQARAELGLAVDDDTHEVASVMVELLAAQAPSEIAAYAQPLWDLLAVSYRADLWAAAYVMNGGASDDGFDYFRGWLVAQGRAVFERALVDPDSLAELPVVQHAAAAGQDLGDEEILGVVWQAYERVTGSELPPDTFSITYPQLDPAWDFSFDDSDEMRRRLPRLTRLYYDDAGA
jgi:hypothetical protein